LTLAPVAVSVAVSTTAAASRCAATTATTTTISTFVVVDHGRQDGYRRHRNFSHAATPAGQTHLKLSELH
jgi:hypothetical protein